MKKEQEIRALIAPLGATLEKDGNLWEILLGPNPMEGIVAYGETPKLAFEEFCNKLEHLSNKILANFGKI